MDRNSVKLDMVSSDGFKTTVPLFNRAYARGLPGSICVGWVRAVGCSKGVNAQFSGILGRGQRRRRSLGRLYAPISWVVGEFHRVARTGMSSRDPTIGEIDVEKFVHVFHDDHVTVKENDSLRGYLLEILQDRVCRTSKSTKLNPLQKTRFVTQRRGAPDAYIPEFSPCVRKPCIEIRESVGVWSGL